jgi:small subunit ribosomal protein S16
MATKMRLQRFGKKGQAYFHIVIADGRAPRDGRFIEKIGIYNPITRPADIQLDFDRALYWVKTGVEPTETVEAILRYTGVAYMHHLLKGVAKGAMTEEQAQAKFEEWKSVKTTKIESAKKEVSQKSKSEDKKRLEAEAKVNQAKADALAKKLAAEAKKAAGIAEVAEEEVAEEVAEVVAEPEAEVVAEPVAEVAAEPIAEVVAEPVAEVVAEPVVEAVAETTTEAAPEETPEAPATEEKA